MLSVLVGLAVLVTASQDWTDYKPASMAKAWAAGVIVQGAERTIEAANVKYVVESTYAGEHRELDAARRELFHAWAQALAHPTEHASLCAHEIQVREGKQTYWLPIQNSLLEPFAREAREGTRLRLHIMYIGAVGQDRVFMVNRFETLEQ